MLPTKMLLNNNEIIKKEILPRKSFFFNTTEKLRILFSFFYLFISLFFIFSRAPLVFFGLAMLGIGLYLAFFRWILKYFDIKNNRYFITNQRIFIAKSSESKIVWQKSLYEVDQINAEMNGRFFGNIIFGEPENIFGKNDEVFSFFRRNGMNFKEDKYAFLSVENINEIIPIFEELGLKVNKTFY
ncbi:hypothetical protein [Chryseobacterium salviniae]|uniref:PH domain-containing protein n=1 Tax=Chryseobacterium salviniae TaxID=3101750 RepID=A0ABU6HWW5_9FLAO|nr:hypothetical protein [Chryseobacterium sp. T9W2-O]MEC3877549.1 hypothetical protein [Chryseobacterium sp. T9W2-O]